MILLLAVIAASIGGNTLTFYFFERLSDQNPSLFDSFWYSIVSISTIGYGDLSATSLGARIGTIVFIVVVGLIAFTTSVGMLVDWIFDIQYKERTGMAKIAASGHLLLVNFPNESRVRQVIEEYAQDPLLTGSNGSTNILVFSQTRVARCYTG